MTATAADVLSTARSQPGTVERPPGSNHMRYGAAYGGDGQAWCAKFVWWVFRESDASGLTPKAAYTPTFAQWFRDRGRDPEETRRELERRARDGGVDLDPHPVTKTTRVLAHLAERHASP